MSDDDATLRGRLEERFDAHKRYLDAAFARHEELDDERFARVTQDVRDQIRSFEKLVHMAVDSAISAHDAKTATERARTSLAATVVLTGIGLLLTYFLVANFAVVREWLTR